MSLVPLFLLALLFSSHSEAAIAPCEKPLREIALKIQVTSDNLANANEPALPGMWPKAKEVVKCKDSKCTVALERGVKLSYEPYNFYSDDLGLVGYPDVDTYAENTKLASLEWEYTVQKQSCEQ